MLLIIPWRGWAPRILARRCSTGASRRFSYLANCAARRSMALVLFAATGSLHIGAGRERTGRDPPGQLNWLASRARKGSGGFGCGGFLFRDYQIGDGADLLRGEVAGRCQSHPGSIDRGVEP
jgi:hypothetical protein